MSGDKLIRELLQDPANPVEAVLCEEGAQTHLNLPLPPEVRLYELKKNLFHELNPIGSSILAVATAPKIKNLDELPKNENSLWLPLGDPHNLGSCLRSALAFDFHHIVLLKESCHPALPKVIKTSSGSTFHLSFYKGPSLQDLTSWPKVRLQNFVSLSASGESIKNFKWPTPTHLLVGEEGKGLPQNLSTLSASIPISPELESLNATVATSIALFSHFQR